LMVGDDDDGDDDDDDDDDGDDDGDDDDDDVRGRLSVEVDVWGVGGRDLLSLAAGLANMSEMSV
jgi:hypothetical protein